MNRRITKLLEISVFNTIRMNFYYFGWGGIFRPRILAAKNLKIQKLDGNVIIKSMKVGAVQIGFGHVGIVDNKICRSLWENSGEICFEGVANLGPGTRIVNSGKLTFGDEFCINAASNIICYKQISFGKDVLISWDCLIMDTDFHRLFSNESRQQINIDRPVVIGNHVWIACKSTILKGSNLPDGSVIAAGSTICKNFIGSNSVYTSLGKIKDDITWEH